MKFTPLDEFNSFSRALFSDEQLCWDLEGNTSVKLMSLNPMEVKLLKHIKFDGMKILTINNIDASSDHPDGGIAFNVNITNTSHIRVELGDIQFDIKYMDQIIGKISSKRFSNDRNTLSFSGCLLQPDTLEGLDAITDVFSKILSREELQFTFDTKECFVSWLDITSLIMIITKETKINFDYELIKCAWDFKFDPKDQYALEVSLHSEIKYFNLFPLGIHKFSCENSSGIIESSIKTKLRLLEESKDLFSEIAKKMYQDEEFILIGDIQVKKIEFNFDKNIKCHIQPGIMIKSMKIIEATKDVLEFKAIATITNFYNFSNIKIDLGINVEFDLISEQNIKIAKITIEDFEMKSENRYTTVRLKYLPNTDNGHLIGNYLNGIDKVILPGLDVPFIDEVEVSFTTKDSFMLHNPLQTRLHLFGFNAKVFNAANEQIAAATKKPSDFGIIVEAGQTEKINIESSNMDIKNLFKNINDCVYGVKENLECVLMFGIGENNPYRIDLNYVQKDVKVIWNVGFAKFFKF
ncbi:22443_t:CDS:2 [Cetraspora pellucida]|uniref:22443_t:CDS:1 n=1 Tax=Cetraspora pellucida TaxID=1433469 RepID=A0A9N9BV31_9GLOM|nr:22443_t:CDS:2 [Cetraspora pellucida]